MSNAAKETAPSQSRHNEVARRLIPLVPTLAAVFFGAMLIVVDKTKVSSAYQDAVSKMRTAIAEERNSVHGEEAESAINRITTDFNSAIDGLDVEPIPIESSNSLH